MKLLLIESYLNKFDGLRNNPIKNIPELVELKTDIYSVITSHEKKKKRNKTFINILHHIALDVNYEIEKCCEYLNSSTEVYNG